MPSLHQQQHNFKPISAHIFLELFPKTVKKIALWFIRDHKIKTALQYKNNNSDL